MKQLLVVILLMTSLAGCLPPGRQLGLSASRDPFLGAFPNQLVATSIQPLYRTTSETDLHFSEVLCFGPRRYEPIQGPMGALIWIRSSQFEFEIEALLRSSLSIEERQNLISASLDPDKAKEEAILLIPCVLEIVSISPLLELPSDIQVSFSYGLDQSGLSFVVVKLRSPVEHKEEILELMASDLGIALNVDYRISDSVIHNAIALLR